MSSLPLTELALIGGAWLAYGLLHSWLASRGCKSWFERRWPALAPAYRLAYNSLAVLLLLPPLWLTLQHPGAALWHVPPWIAWPAAAITVVGFIWSLRWYDMGEFLGLSQWRRRDGSEHAGFVLSPMHRYVRHPWYSLGLLMLWTRDLNAAWLATAVALTVYVLIGSRLEEDKLIERYGDAYRRYRARVPGLVPLPGRHLSAAEAQNLLQASGAEVCSGSSIGGSTEPPASRSPMSGQQETR